MIRINNTTYILVHDQDILLSREKNNKYKTKYKYLFMGFKPIDKINDLIKLKKVIICRNLKNNIDHLDSRLLSFVGWYAAAKNNLIKTPFVTLFEYDVIFNKNLNFNNRYLINGYIADKIRPYDSFFYKNNYIKKFVEKNSFKKDFSDLNKNVYSESNTWCATSNFTLRKNVFEDFVDWYYDLITKNDLLNDYGISQIHERIISYYALLNNIKINLNKNIINHQRKNSHEFNYD